MHCIMQVELSGYNSLSFSSIAKCLKNMLENQYLPIFFQSLFNFHLCKTTRMEQTSIKIKKRAEEARWFLHAEPPNYGTGSQRFKQF